MNHSTHMQLFRSSDYSLRTTEVDGETFLAGKDVCRSLGISTSNLSKTLDDDELMTVHYTAIGQLAKRGNPDVILINEAGFWKLVMKSRKPEAKTFQRWVTHEVLPAIRQTGAYMTPESAISERLAVGDTDAVITFMESSVNLSKQLRAENVELQPKAERYDRFIDSDGLFSTTEVAKTHGMSAVSLNLILHEKGVIFKQRRSWIPYAKYQERFDLFQIKLFPYPSKSTGEIKHSTTIYWTPTGCDFIADLLAEQLDMTGEGA